MIQAFNIDKSKHQPGSERDPRGLWLHRDTCLDSIISLHWLKKYMTQTCERDMDCCVGGLYQEKLLSALFSLSGDGKTTKQYQRISKVTTSKTDGVCRDGSLMGNSTKACYWMMRWVRTGCTRSVRVCVRVCVCVFEKRECVSASISLGNFNNLAAYRARGVFWQYKDRLVKYFMGCFIINATEAMLKVLKQA